MVVAFAVAAASAGCILTKDIPDPALEIPERYKAASRTGLEAPPPRRLLHNDRDRADMNLFWQVTIDGLLTGCMYAMISFGFDDVPASAAEIGAAILEKRGLKGTYFVAAALAGTDAVTGPMDAPAIVDHPDALAVWEYLDRTVDPSIISRALNLVR